MEVSKTSPGLSKGVLTINRAEHVPGEQIHLLGSSLRCMQWQLVAAVKPKEDEFEQATCGVEPVPHTA